MPSVCFLTHIHDEESFILMQQHAIGWLYCNPEAKLLVISDGYALPEARGDFCDIFDRVILFECEKIKTPPYIRWINRFFNAFLYYSTADYLIRLDPDTVCWRGMYNIPKADIFGTYLRGVQPHIQGGCIGFSKDIAVKFVNAEVKPSKVRPAPDSPNEHYSDLVLFDIMKNQLGAKTYDWKEVKCHPFKSPVNRCYDGEFDYAFTHPHVVV